MRKKFPDIKGVLKIQNARKEPTTDRDKKEKKRNIHRGEKRGNCKQGISGKGPPNSKEPPALGKVKERG